VDTNSVAAGLLSDMAAIQPSKERTRAYQRAADVIFTLDDPLEALVDQQGTLPKLRYVGPSSSRVIREVLESAGSPTVERAIAESGRAEEIQRRRALREGFFSRAQVRRLLHDASLGGPAASDYLGDFQMHSQWSDGRETLADLVNGCIARGYRHSAVTDHSAGLRIARGLTADDFRRQHQEIDALNQTLGKSFRLLKGVEGNIRDDGSLDVANLEEFDLVLAAPHGKLRGTEDQTERMLRAISVPGVHILAHPRGRKSGARAGIVADWNRVFRAAARLKVAVEIDGDPSRQDLDHTIARDAFDAGCLFALDSDGHSLDQLNYAETAIVHAKLAGIPKDRIVNCWPLEKLLKWARELSARAK
jgi:histidinol phosphatase-like PHP family hydrolase